METSKELFLQERHQEILRVLGETGRVSVLELSEQFGVSGVTIRSDLQALAQKNLLVRTHGGAVAPNRGLHDLYLSLRLQLQMQEKERIGHSGANRVVDGDAIFLDTSSTTLTIARNLKTHRYVTVITNSLAVAQELLDAPGVTVVMPGGKLRSETASLVGLDGLEILHKFNIQKGFFGAHGITVADGLTDVSADEADLKRPLIAMCRQVIAVLDATKWGKVGLAPFATLQEIDEIITDKEAPAEMVEQVQSLGIKIELI
jgi:DeoR/GlpR family transcriptional regulator of sugar metabolism